MAYLIPKNSIYYQHTDYIRHILASFAVFWLKL